MLTHRGMIAALVLFIVALALLITSKPPSSGHEQPAPNAALVLEPGAKKMQISDLKGKVVILDFWATWCGPCRQSIPEVERIYKKYKDKGLVVIGVSEDAARTQGNIPAVQQALGMTYPIMLGMNSPEIIDKYERGSIPILYVIDKQGNIRQVQQGFDPGRGLAEVEDLVQQLLDE